LGRPLGGAATEHAVITTPPGRRRRPRRRVFRSPGRPIILVDHTMTTTSPLAAPQLVVDSRMLYTSWIPADPAACAALLPRALRPATSGAVYMNQYVVDSAAQTTGFGAYSLTYLGVDLDQFAPDGVTPARFFTQYFNSSPIVRA